MMYSVMVRFISPLLCLSTKKLLNRLLTFFLRATCISLILVASEADLEHDKQVCAHCLVAQRVLLQYFFLLPAPLPLNVFGLDLSAFSSSVD